MKFALILLLGLAWPAVAEYQIPFWTIDGGGHQSSGGVYSLTGTIGQPDANIHTGGSYTLSGGFWSGLESSPNPGGPTLRILYANTRVILAWPNPSSGYQLQMSPNLSGAVWTDVNDAPSIVGAEKQVTQPIQPGMQFFRLRHP